MLKNSQRGVKMLKPLLYEEILPKIKSGDFIALRGK